MKTQKLKFSPKAALMRDALKKAGIKFKFTQAEAHADASFDLLGLFENHAIQVLEGPAYDGLPKGSIFVLNKYHFDTKGELTTVEEIAHFSDGKHTAQERVIKRLLKIESDLQKVDDSNEAQVAEKTISKKAITDKKDLLYNYPEDMDDLSKRKKFRTKVRGMFKKLDKEISRLKGSKNKEDLQLLAEKQKERETYAKKYLAKVNS